MYGLTWSELVELGGPKMKGQCHISIKKRKILSCQLDPLEYVIFIKSTWLLGPKAFTYGKIGLYIFGVMQCNNVLLKS
jgi:hypothetical protein